MKKFLIGVLVGCLLMMTTPVLADSIIQSIDVVLNSVEVQVNGEKLDANTILYNGSTYLPMRKVAEAVGKDVAWNQATMTANIVEKTNVTEGDKMIENEMNNTENGIILNNIEYYRYDYVRILIDNSSNENYSIYNSNVNGNTIKLTFSKFTGNIGQNEEVLIDSIPYELMNDKIFISKDYYENTILPLIK